jgi:uroporphyrinogen decarboxylase
MNGYERFMTALRREVPDRVPVWELIVNEPTLSAWGATTLEEFVEQEDLDAITVFEDMPLEKIAGERTSSATHADTRHSHGPQDVADDWGIVWGSTEQGIPYPVSGPIASNDDLRRYQPPDPDADYRLDSLRSAVGRFKGRRAIVFLTHDAFEFSHYLRGGIDRLMLDYLENAHLAHALAEMAIHYKTRLMQRAIAMGADVVISGDDYAGRTGPMMSPRHFDEFVLPYLRRSIETAHDANVPYIKHTDGNIWQLLPAMVDAGIDAIDPLEPLAGMDIGQVKGQYGDRIALVGNVDCTELLPHASQDAVEEAVKETIAKAAPGGGYILASSNSVHPAVLPENYRAMTEAARRWGTYPLEQEMVRQYADRHYIAAYA